MARTIAIAAICLTMLAVSARKGIDSYEIYLNGKLLLRQVADRSFSLQSLHLNASQSDEKLVIYYYQCNAPSGTGKGRSISVKDGNGRILKEWKFADAAEGNGGMPIPVKEILQLAKGTGILHFYYVSGERPKGQILASFQRGEKNTATK